MIIERHKVKPDLAKALEEANLSQYSTLEIPQEEYAVEFDKLAVLFPKLSFDELSNKAVINIAKKLYGGDRSAVFNA